MLRPQTVAASAWIFPPMAMALRAVRDTGGALIECEDGELLEGIAALAWAAVFAEPSAAASYVALVKARAGGD